MDGRSPRAIMFVNTGVNDPAKEAEYQRWYLDVHFADVTEPGIFTSASMLHNAAQPPPAGEQRFLAFYECFWEDLAGACRAFSEHVGALFAGQQIHAGTVGAHFGIYALRESASTTARRRRTQSLLAWHLAVEGPAARAAGLAWLREVALPAALETGLFHTLSVAELLHGSVSFNRLREPASAAASARDPDLEPPLLLLLESDLGDPGFLAEHLRKRIGAAPLPERCALVRRSSFYRATP